MTGLTSPNAEQPEPVHIPSVGSLHSSTADTPDGADFATAKTVAMKRRAVALAGFEHDRHLY